MLLDTVPVLKRAQDLKHGECGVGDHNSTLGGVRNTILLGHLTIEASEILERQHDISGKWLVALFSEDIEVFVAKQLLEMLPKRYEEFLLDALRIGIVEIHDDWYEHFCLVCEHFDL